MKSNFFILFTIIFSNTYSQFGPQRIIANEAQLPVAVFAVDIDGDGNLDILSAARYDKNITWYKNLDGMGNFGPLNLIGLLDEVKSIYAADLDGDGDMDILATASFLDVVVWYENLDGLGNFSSQKTISDNADGAFSVIAADLDGDGDNDVVSASYNSGLMWYENLDGQGNFSANKIIDDNILGARSVVAADMDGDGDLDVVVNTSNIAEIVWYENLDGLGNFGPPIAISGSGSYTNVIFVADIDGDGDMDILSASPGDSEVAWYENLDGLGNFGPKNIITDSLYNAWTVYAADLDNDGDMDILIAVVETFGGEILWFENLDGLGNFSEKKTITTEVKSPRSVIAADIDNDGDMDVISSSQNDNKIAWYENQTIIGIDENLTSALKVYPNPVKGVLNIEAQASLEIKSVMLYDTFGRLLLKKASPVSQLNFGNYAAGIYFLKLETNIGKQVFKVIKE